MAEAFRSVATSEVSEAYAVYVEVFEWLNAKGVRQWLKAVPSAAFFERQRKGELFSECIDGRLAAVVTLARESSSYWAAEMGTGQSWWIKSLAVGRAYSGTGLGERMMRESESFIAATGATTVFLDCVDTGFFPEYYVRHGYETLDRKDITYPSGNTFPMVLMSKQLPHQR